MRLYKSRTRSKVNSPIRTTLFGARRISKTRHQRASRHLNFWYWPDVRTRSCGSNNNEKRKKKRYKNGMRNWKRLRVPGVIFYNASSGTRCVRSRCTFTPVEEKRGRWFGFKRERGSSIAMYTTVFFFLFHTTFVYNEMNFSRDLRSAVDKLRTMIDTEGKPGMNGVLSFILLMKMEYYRLYDLFCFENFISRYPISVS